MKDLKNLKDNKSLTSSKLEIRCEDQLIHLPTKLKKISRLSQDNKEDRIRRAICTHYLINTKLYLWNTFFNLFDFQLLRNFVFINDPSNPQLAAICLLYSSYTSANKPYCQPTHLRQLHIPTTRVVQIQHLACITY